MDTPPTAPPSDLLVGLLLDDDHKRGCQGRMYACTCGYDDAVQDAAMAARQAAQPAAPCGCFQCTKVRVANDPNPELMLGQPAALTF